MYFTLVGVMVGAGMTRHKAWDDVVLKLQSRLSKWKAKTLSIGGRLTLLKSVLGASPLYNMSIFKVPKGVLKVMESIRSNFFKDDSLWFRVIKRFIGVKIGLLIQFVRFPYEFDFASSSSLKSSGFDFLSYCSKRIGDGQSTSFWKETWIGDIPLCELCPRLFALDSAPNICVAAKMAGPLDTSFRRSVRGGV
ncbi:hypothetical protein Tco_0261673 [Tanacetum coccineum]